MALTEFLKNHEIAARKIFGAKELEIIFKQLNGYVLKQSEMNRLSRDIRQKFAFIAECSRFSGEFALKKNQTNKKIIADTLVELMNDQSFKDINAILLGGSYANGEFTPESDIDIFVVFKKSEVSIKEATIFRKRMLARLHPKVDLQVFNALPENIKQDVLSNHRVIFKMSNDRRKLLEHNRAS